MIIYYIWDDLYCIDYANSIYASPTDNDKYFIMFTEPTNNTVLSSIAEYDRSEIEYMFSEAVQHGYLSLGFVTEVETDD